MWGDYCILLSLYCCIAKYNLAVVARDHIRRDRSGASSVPRRGVWGVEGMPTSPGRPNHHRHAPRPPTARLQHAVCTLHCRRRKQRGRVYGRIPALESESETQPTNPQQVQCIAMESLHRPAPRFGSHFSLLFSILSSPRWRYSLPVLLQALMPAEPRYVRICMFTHYTHPDDRITT